MDFSRETLAAFSDALATLHGTADLRAAVQPLLADLRALFSGSQVYACRGDEVVEMDSRQVAPVGVDTGGHELVFRLPDSPLSLVVRRGEPFGEPERFLADQLREHLAAAVAPRSPSAEATGAADEEARETPHWRHLMGLGLTERECEVLHWITRGKRDAEIGALLGIASKTVSKHVENILRKLDAENRLSAAQTAAEWLRRLAGRDGFGG